MQAPVENGACGFVTQLISRTRRRSVDEGRTVDPRRKPRK
jgi:hypothetical protein